MKTAGNGNYELYDYDACDQMTSIGYWWADGTGQNALVYSYDAAGSVHTMNQGYYSTTYGYDGADQLVSEASTGSYPPPSLGYTYDHNGNRLTQTSNGAQVQSFTYDSHDKLTSGTAGSESDGYDKNGSETSTTIAGGTYRETYDDEDRLTSLTTPGGITDTFVYNGLGLRVGKTDSTGTYSYVCDGTTPASPVLSDGHTLFTPGLSENTGGTSRYYSNDLLGNLWTIDGSAKSQLDYQDTTGFGTTFAQAGSGSVFGFGGGNGCQTDADAGLILMGHRYYDTRIGRFLTQDPAGSGNNWYAYAGNSPTNNTDPMGLAPMDGPGSSPVGSPGYMDGAASGIGGSVEEFGIEWHQYFVGGLPYKSIDTPGVQYDWYSTYWAPNLFDGVGGAFGVGFSAVGSAFTGGLWNGGAARHDPSFGVSRNLAYAGIAAGGAALGGVAAVGKAAEETVTVARWGRSGLQAGDWVMKGKATPWNYIRSFKWQPGLGNQFAPLRSGEEFTVPTSSVKWPTGAGIDGWWEGLFGQRIYTP